MDSSSSQRVVSTSAAVHVSSEVSPPPVHEGSEPSTSRSNGSTTQRAKSASALRTVLDTSGDNVKVICRVRPFDKRELSIQAATSSAPIRSVIHMNQKETIFLDHTKDFVEKERFHFDHSIWSIPETQQENSQASFASQQDVFDTVGLHALEHCWQGYNTSLFAYGQTGSGKTYTMMGQQDDPGMIPRLCQELFKSVQEREMKDASDRLRSRSTGNPESGGNNTSSGASGEVNEIREYIVEARFMEIYKERAHDLLIELNHKGQPVNPYNERESLKVRNFPGRGPDVMGLTTLAVSDWESCMQLINHGISNRTVASTKMNEQSSRSHCLFRLSFTQKTTILPKKVTERAQILLRSSQINLVDLAGSERNKKSGARGEQLKEAASINKSLTVLKEVIDSLVERKPYIPYRDSMLTWLLSESLGGNSKTFMIACVSPHYDNADETLNTLRYALRARGIKNKAEINDCDDMKRMERLRAEITHLQQEIDKGGSQDLNQELVTMKETLAQMQTSLSEADTLAVELREAYKAEMERRYAASFLTGFRLTREQRQADLVADYASTLVSQLNGTDQDVRKMRKQLEDLQISITNLKEAEAALAESNQEKRELLHAIQEHHKKMERTDVPELRAKLEREVSLKTTEFKNVQPWSRMYCTLMKDAMRTRLSERLRREFEAYRKTKEDMVRANTHKESTYEGKSRGRQQDLETRTHHLQTACAALAREVDHTRGSLDLRYMHLRQEHQDVKTALEQQTREHKEKYERLWNDHVAQYEAKHEEMLRQLSSATKKNKDGHTQAVQAVRATSEELATLWQHKLAAARAAGSQRQQEINQRWEERLKEFQADSTVELNDLNEAEKDIISVIQEAQRTYKSRTVTVDEVEKALKNPMFKSLLVDSGYAYHSITPTFYSLARAPTLYARDAGNEDSPIGVQSFYVYPSSTTGGLDPMDSFMESSLMDKRGKSALGSSMRRNSSLSSPVRYQRGSATFRASGSFSSPPGTPRFSSSPRRKLRNLV